MKAAVLNTFNSPLSIQEIPVPSPRVGEVLIKVMATGLCATDLHIIEGIIPSVKLPYVPGHEMAGIVEEIGEGVSDTLLGKHAIVYIDVTDGSCRYCTSGRPNLCTSLVRIGFEMDGSHQQYCVVPEKNVCVMNNSIPFEQAAIVPDAVACMLHAIKNQAQLKPDQWICIMGAGGIGLQGVQIAKHYGAKVIATARTPQRLELAKEMGADFTVNVREEDLISEVTRITGGKLCDVVLDCIGTESSPDLGVSICSPGGKIVLAAYTVPKFSVNYQQIVIREKELIGIRGATYEALKESIDLVGKGIITPFVYKTIPFDEINSGLAEIHNGTALGRIVALPWG